MAEKVIIKEVAARDGLQAQPKHLTVEQRIALLGALAETGVPELEIGSFVSPKAVPQTPPRNVGCSILKKPNKPRFSPSRERRVLYAHNRFYGILTQVISSKGWVDHACFDQCSCYFSVSQCPLSDGAKCYRGG